MPIKNQVLSIPEWQDYLSIQQVGIALEKLGGLVNTLEFYEQFVEYFDSEISQFARERWIATKKKQVDYARHQNKPQNFIKIQSELLKKAQTWQIPPDSVSLIPPAAPKERPTPQTRRELINSFATGILEDKNTSIFQVNSELTKQESSKLSAIVPITLKSIQGLPSETEINELENDILQFTLRHLVIKIMKQTKQILITDSLNNREVRIDAKQCQINIGDAAIEAPGGKELSFSFFHSSYSGKLLVDQLKSRLELDIQGLTGRIYIDL